MINPMNFTYYGLDRWKREEMLLFAFFVAGKNAKTTARLLDNALASIGWSEYLPLPSPLACLREFCTKKTRVAVYGLGDEDDIYDVKIVPEKLTEWIKRSKLGCYNLKTKGLLNIVMDSVQGGLLDAALDNRTSLSMSKLALTNCTGIGLKTSRFYLLHTRKDFADKLAVLDRHMLTHLRNNNITRVPLNTPSTHSTYERLEQEVLKLAQQANMTSAEFDLAVWRYYSGNSKMLP